MTPTRPWRTALIACAALFTVITAPLAASQSGGHAPDHMAAHGASCSAGSSTVSTCNAGMTSGTAGMMGTGTPMNIGAIPMERFDLMFIDMMIAHHQSAIAMAFVVIEQGTDPALVTLAGDILDTHESDIDRMQEWRGRWYPNAPEFLMGPAVSEMMQDSRHLRGMPHLHMLGLMDPEIAAETIRNAPETVDLAFVNAMLLHHQGAAMMMEAAVLNAGHPELAGLAGTMLEDHQEHLTALHETHMS